MRSYLISILLLLNIVFIHSFCSAAIKEGDSGAEVAQIQQILIARGYLTGNADGICGSTTVAAIKKFQAAQGLTVDGICGEATLNLLMETVDTTIDEVKDSNYTIKYGMRGADVEELQNILIALGYMSGTADGVAGSATVEAIRSFQSTHGLNADGVCGESTFDAINAEAEAFMAGETEVANENKNIPNENTAVIGSVIKFGMTGEGVADLQRKLIDRGFLNGQADGICGNATVEAIRKFQSTVGLESDGIAGVATLSRLNDYTEVFNSDSGDDNYPAEIANNGGYAEIGSVIKPGMHGPGVSDIQRKLIEHGFLTGHADGIAGQRTVAAIKRFQESVGIKADGVCGLQTYAALEDADYNISDTSWEDEVDDMPTLGRSVYVEATAYSPFDPGVGTHTARGNIVRRGIIAVDPRFIPLGTRVYIPGYGEAVADDTGGAIVGNRIDIAFDTYDEAMRFGRQHIEIYILDN